MSASPDDLMEAQPVEPLPFPTSVRVAGVLWIIVGAVFVLVTVGVQLAVVARADLNRPAAPGGNGTSCVGTLIGLGFFFAGTRVLRGISPDTLVTSILSLLVGVLYLGVGAMALRMADTAPARVPDGLVIVMIIAGIVSVGTGAALSLAGILGLVGRSGYLSWLDDQPDPRARRRRRRRPTPYAEEVDDEDSGRSRRDRSW